MYLEISATQKKRPELYLSKAQQKHKRLIRCAVNQGLASHSVSQRRFNQLQKAQLLEKTPIFNTVMFYEEEEYLLPYAFFVKTINYYAPHGGKGRPGFILIAYSGYIAFTKDGKLVRIAERRPVHQNFYFDGAKWVLWRANRRPHKK